MKRTLTLLFTVFFSSFLVQAQPKIKEKKYPSLLWEITGNGMKKPSYLIGTMHVSSKLAFHLPDSFYIALRTAQVVALETNPETWQEDMSKYDINSDKSSEGYGNYAAAPNEYLGISTLKFFKYGNKIERALYSNPSTINNLLYRSYGNKSSDFEEDTYLDMYIFQCGKKWGKTVTGVENYGESMQLMAEAYKDAARDRNKKERSYDGADDYSTDKIQEAYRSGNLDLLDSINKYNSFSAAFDEKFMYRRNEIQANSMDSIIQSGSSLFAGVGAAHLPGSRGVIELLRKKGYRLRPVNMGERDSRDKEEVDKLRVPVVFRTETTEDKLFKVDIPGKFYKFGDDGALDQKQYADMANGSYYIVTRVMTNAWMWGHTTDNVYKTIDSLLYENIPGKIISKTAISKNGYKGFDITNRTRRGDLQRYNIFITPFEIIFFKMSGNGDYVKNGDEARRFFGSIQFREYKAPADPANTGWKKYSPAYGGFSIDLPHEPYIGNDGSWVFDAEDKSTGTNYRVIRTDIHNYHFIEEDSFDLGLMEESFMASDFIDTELVRKQINYKGYPALDCRYKDKSGAIYMARFIIQGAHYYTLIARGKKETAEMNNFLNSFAIKPLLYSEAKQQKDSSLYFSALTPVFREVQKIKLRIPGYSYFSNDDGDEDESEADLLEGGVYRNKTISDDSTGEKLYVSFYRPSRYYYIKDSAALERKNDRISIFGDTTWMVKLRKKTVLPDHIKVSETIVTDSGSSRALWIKTYYKDGIGYSLLTEMDTLAAASSFVKRFYETFTPAALKGINPFVKKSALFFEDFMSEDSSLHKRAVTHIDDIDLDSSDIPQLKTIITGLNWNEKKYLDTKKSLIAKLGDIATNNAANYLKELYYALDDTVQLQYTVLESLLQQQTSYAFTVFRNIVNTEAPVLEFKSGGGNNLYSSLSKLRYQDNDGGYDNGNFLDELTDSLELTRSILPDLLPLLNLDDYKSNIMRLLGLLVDSNLVKPADYVMYFSKFMIEAKQELKKQSIAEKRKAIAKAEQRKTVKNTSSFDEDGKDNGNDDLSLYATLLLPYWESNPAVQPLIQQMLQSNDRQLKYKTALLLLRHNRECPDSLLQYFAGLDDYRYQLYTALKEMKKGNKFPALYNNHLDLGRSALLNKKTYNKPDSVVYLDRLNTNWAGRKGFIYFYKYKSKKDDLNWKLASVGLVPEDPKQFEFEQAIKTGSSRFSSYFNSTGPGSYDFTGFSDTRLRDDEPLSEQLKKALRKILYGHRKSAKQFYNDDNGRSNGTDYDD